MIKAIQSQIFTNVLLKIEVLIYHLQLFKETKQNLLWNKTHKCLPWVRKGCGYVHFWISDPQATFGSSSKEHGQMETLLSILLTSSSCPT